MRGLRPAALFLLAVSCGLSLRALAQADVPATAQKAFDEGNQFEERKQLSSALDSYRAALKTAGNCGSCLDAIERVQMHMELFRDAAATADRMAAQAPNAPAKSLAEQRGGLAFFDLYFAQTDGRGAIDKDAKKAAVSLKQAEAVLAQGEKDDPANEAVRMLHGRVLAAMKRDEDAGREFAACAADKQASPQECARALHYAKDVSIARNEPAPPFTLKTIDGKTVTLDSLAGKVVLMDFWATWCKFCERDSDYVQSMMDSFDKDKFALVEVSVDEQQAKWENYVHAKRLEGIQGRDEKGEVTGLFHVTGYPTYVVLDGDGTIRLRAVGIEGDLKGTVRKLLAATPEPPPGARVPLPKASAQ